MMEDLRFGRPVERVWVLWHALVGLGAGLIFIPYGPSVWLTFMFLISALTVIVGGVQFQKKQPAIIGLVTGALAMTIRIVQIWGYDTLGAGTKSIGTFLWAMFAVGAVMEAWALRYRGL